MKIAVDRDRLNAALEVAAPLASSRIIPVLACVKLSVAETGLTVEATDMGMAACAWINDRVAGGGAPLEVCVEAAPFASFVKLAPGALVEIEKTDGAFVVRSGRARVTLGAVDARDFPQMSGPREVWSRQLPAASLLRVLGMTAPMSEPAGSS